MTQSTNPILDEAAGYVRARLGDRLSYITLDRAVFGLFFSGVRLSTGEAGLCFTPLKEIPEAVCCPSSARAMPMSGRMQGTTGSEMLDWLGNPNPLKAALGIAALNALTEHCSEPGEVGGYRQVVGDAFDAVSLQHQRAVVVGALVPMMRRLKNANIDWAVLEMDAATLKGEERDHFVPAERYADVLPGAGLVVITGVTILNGSLPDLLSTVDPDAEVLVVGPTASMSPVPLFGRGVTMVGGLKVTDPDLALDTIAEGGSGYHLFGRSAEQTIVTAA